MTNQSTTANQKSEETSFNIYVDLFDKGEFDLMNVSRQSGEYHVNFDNRYLGTLIRNSDNNWEVTNGAIPASIMPDITSKITRSLEIN